VNYSGPPKCPKISVLAAMIEEGVLGYQRFEESVTDRDFASLIINWILKNRMQEEGLGNYIFFCDNHKTHTAKI